jgi:hypothetical protein
MHKILSPTTAAKTSNPNKKLLDINKAKEVAIKTTIKTPTQLLSFSFKKILWKKLCKGFEETGRFRISISVRI